MNDSKLASPLTLPCGACLPNRIAKAAMTEGLADLHDNPGERLNTLYRRWSLGGAGLCVTGNAMVDRRYLERPGNMVLDEHSDGDAFRQLARAGTEGGNHLWMQISHVGRQCNRASGNQPVSPSDIGLDLMGLFRRPRAMTVGEIEDAIRRYVYVATVAKDCGFTGVQIHGAHGYLISQFLSPRINQREDDWGGTLANRARFLLRIVAATRDAVGDDFPVGVKLNSADFQKGGFDAEDSLQVARWLEAGGVDLLEISGGTYEQPQLLGHEGIAKNAMPPKRESTIKREAYFLAYAEAMRQSLSMPMMVTGGFRSAEGMQAALASGAADVIGLGRPLCVDPDLPRKLLDGDAARCPAWEHKLNLGRGFFGPTSPLLLMRMVNIQGEVAWFYRQLIRLAEDRDPDTELGLIRALYRHLRDEQRLGRERRKAQRDQA